MQTTTADTPEAGRRFAQLILAELRTMRTDLNLVTREVGILNECAGLLLRPQENGDESTLSAMMRLMGLLIAGTEETHKKLETMNGALFDSRMSSALRAAILDS